MNWLLDRRLRRTLHRLDLPDLPEVRRLARLSYWNGFTFGALNAKMPAAHAEAMLAVAQYEAETLS